MTCTSTLAIIKPEAVQRKLTGPVLETIEKAGFTIVALKKLRLTKAEADDFYQIHRGQPYFEGLTEYMSSGPVVAMVLEKDEATVEAFRELMGATDPADAAPGTIRARWGESIQRNVIHGSDCAESAVVEKAFFFSEFELAGRAR